MKKRPYRSVSVKDVSLMQLSSKVVCERLVVGIDVAKERFYATLMDERRETIANLRWLHPQETPRFVELLEALPASRVEAATESSGSYGDALEALLRRRGVVVFRVSPKRVHDSAEVYDGVPSLHDAKAGGLIARLHLDGLSRLVEPRTELEKSLGAAIRTMDLFHAQMLSNHNRIEALLATHWPELSRLLELGSASMIELLARFGSPEAVAADPVEARKAMRDVSRGGLRKEKIVRVLESAQTSLGVRPIAEELAAIKTLARDTQRAKKAYQAAKRRVEQLADQHAAVRAMSATAGKVTSAVLISELGDPQEYRSAAAYVKAAGLNLKERSSGTHKGKLRITKRGSGRARKYLYLAAMRLIQDDVVTQAWYAKKVARDGGVKMKALIGVMRKYLGALWHVAREQSFDSTKLFDVSRLQLAA